MHGQALRGGRKSRRRQQDARQNRPPAQAARNATTYAGGAHPIHFMLFSHRGLTCRELGTQSMQR
jgi:hypothetical protein